LPDGRKPLTLRDTADYVTKQPKKESGLPTFSRYWSAVKFKAGLDQRGRGLVKTDDFAN
jgi:hypothetical protein